jgi:hypothetical protein
LKFPFVCFATFVVQNLLARGRKTEKPRNSLRSSKKKPTSTRESVSSRQYTHYKNTSTRESVSSRQFTHYKNTSTRKSTRESKPEVDNSLTTKTPVQENQSQQ